MSGIHYPKSAKKAVIPNSRGDKVVGDAELFTTVNIGKYDEDIRVGGILDGHGSSMVRSTHALQAWFDGKDMFELSWGISNLDVIMIL